MKNLKMGLLLSIFVYIFIELASLLSLAVIDRLYQLSYTPIFSKLTERQENILTSFLNGESRYMRFDTLLGWSIIPGGKSGPYQANAQGIRADIGYSQVPATGITRIAAFGDSFTHCDDVANPDTWETVIESGLDKVEVMNFGVGGFGLDQALLRYRRDGTGFHPKIILIGFMTENINRSVNVFRPFYSPTTGLPLAKPRFLLRNDGIRLQPNPVSSLAGYRAMIHEKMNVSEMGSHDYFYQRRYQTSRFDFLPSVRFFKIMYTHFRDKWSPVSIEKGGFYNIKSEAFRVTTATFEAFAREAEENGSQPVIVLFPSQEDISRYRKIGEKQYNPLLAFFREKGFRYIDIMDGFEKYGKKRILKELFTPHYSPLANRMVGKHIIHELRKMALLPGSRHATSQTN